MARIKILSRATQTRWTKYVDAKRKSNQQGDVAKALKLELLADLGRAKRGKFPNGRILERVKEERLGHTVAPFTFEKLQEVDK